MIQLGSRMISILVVRRDEVGTHEVAEILNTAHFAGMMLVYARRFGDLVCIAFRRGSC